MFFHTIFLDKKHCIITALLNRNPKGEHKSSFTNSTKDIYYLHILMYYKSHLSMVPFWEKIFNVLYQKQH